MTSEHGSESEPEFGIFKVVRRLNPQWEKLPRVGFGNLILDTEASCILVKGGIKMNGEHLQTIYLTPSENSILRLLMLVSSVNAKEGRIVEKEEMRDWLDKYVRWPKDRYLYSGTLKSEDTMLLTLRKKIAGLEGCDVEVRTEYGRGCQLIIKSGSQ